MKQYCVTRESQIHLWDKIAGQLLMFTVSTP